MAEMLGGKWWAWQGLNLRPLRCQRSALSRFAQKTATSDNLNSGTGGEQTRFARPVYRALTATPGPRP